MSYDPEAPSVWDPKPPPKLWLSAINTWLAPAAIDGNVGGCYGKILIDTTRHHGELSLAPSRSLPLRRFYFDTRMRGV
jgi:hypothetical protein